MGVTIMEFNDIFELKKRVMPALRKRESDLNLRGFSVTCDDIWNDLKTNKWSKGYNLSLNEIVNDILKYELNEGKMLDEK